MQQFLELMHSLIDFLRIRYTVWGFSFSLFQVFCYMEVGKIVFRFMGRIFGKEEVSID